jgi:hypothetical protein
MLREQKQWQVQPRQQYCHHYSLPPMTAMTTMTTMMTVIYPRKI